MCDGIQEEEDSKGGDGWERARHPWEMPRPVALSGLYTGTRGTSTHGEQQGAGWALGTADQEAQRCRGGFSYTVSVLGCFEPVACLLSDREVVAVTLPCSHPILPPSPLLLSPCSFSSSSSTRPGLKLHEAAPRVPGKPQLGPTQQHSTAYLQ